MGPQPLTPKLKTTGPPGEPGLRLVMAAGSSAQPVMELPNMTTQGWSLGLAASWARRSDSLWPYSPSASDGHQSEAT